MAESRELDESISDTPNWDEIYCAKVERFARAIHDTPAHYAAVLLVDHYVSTEATCAWAQYRNELANRTPAVSPELYELATARLIAEVRRYLQRACHDAVARHAPGAPVNSTRHSVLESAKIAYADSLERLEIARAEIRDLSPYATAAAYFGPPFIVQKGEV
jgi:hypothetical protein